MGQGRERFVGSSSDLVLKHMVKILEKVERRLGEKLFLKGERCAGPKCALIRRASLPGANKKTASRRRKTASEYGLLLREKQKVRFFYGLDDYEVEMYSGRAERKGIYNSQFLSLLESRLDTVVRYCGFAVSQREARTLVKYGHIAVNGRKVTIPSYQVKKGDSIAIRERSLRLPLFADIDIRLKKHSAPPWILLDAQKREGVVTGVSAELPLTVDVAKVKEFYSR